MTWQRIDDDTYIDDTLVTCAEYQLFIDEMREQGKYYQPDHWTSYQFPSGRAHTPIVGVRFNDAKLCCKWLTKREMGDWFFRLPEMTETTQFPLMNSTESPLGYWAVDMTGNIDFAWTGEIPLNPRNLDILFPINETYVPFVLSVNFGVDEDYARPDASGRNLALDFGQSSILDGDQILQEYFDNINNRDINPARIDAIESLRSFIYGHAFDYAMEFNPLSSEKPNLPLAKAQDLVLALDNYVDLYLIFYTLQERILGRSPAFEGIRLVKERIK